MVRFCFYEAIYIYMCVSVYMCIDTHGATVRSVVSYYVCVSLREYYKMQILCIVIELLLLITPQINVFDKLALQIILF